MIPQNKLDVLKELGSATIHEAQGRTGAFDCGIKPIDPGMKIAGPAYTIDSEPADNLMLHLALTRIKPGEILVVDAKGFLESGIWGDVMTAGAQAKQAGGLVVDGAVRDSETMIETGFPVFARALSIKGSGKRQIGKVETTIICGGATVRMGDIIVGDRDGLVVVDPARVDEVIALSEARERKETELRGRLKAGETTFDIMGLASVIPDMPPRT